MARKTQTLPRHTNLASQSMRLVASIVDIAIGLAITFAFYFGCFNLIFANKTNTLLEQVEAYRIESHLQVRDEKGAVTIVDDTSKEALTSALEGYYLRYLPGNPYPGEQIAPNHNEPIEVDGKKVLPKDYYTIQFYNNEVLGIPKDSDPEAEKSTSIFTYQKDKEGNYLYDRVGVARDHYYDTGSGEQQELTDALVLAQYKIIYYNAFYHFAAQDFYQTVANEYYFYYTLAIAGSILSAGIVCYIILPLFLKNGQTLGKKIFKLGLASYDGYKYHPYQLLLRFVPFFIVVASFLLPIWGNIFLIFAFVIVVLLISFALMMASPKRAALHDFAARTIVVDLASSIIFENELLEEDYINKEDNLPREVYAGEEPELKYER